MGENDSKIDQELMIECIKIASDKLPDFGFDSVTAYAKDLYNFVKNDKLKVILWLRDDEGNYLHTETHDTTYSELLKDYIRLKKKERTQKAIQAKCTANDSKPLNGNIKAPKSFFSFLRKYF